MGWLDGRSELRHSNLGCQPQFLLHPYLFRRRKFPAHRNHATGFSHLDTTSRLYYNCHGIFDRKKILEMEPKPRKQLRKGHTDNRREAFDRSAQVLHLYPKTKAQATSLASLVCDM